MIFNCLLRMESDDEKLMHDKSVIFNVMCVIHVGLRKSDVEQASQSILIEKLDSFKRIPSKKVFYQAHWWTHIKKSSINWWTRLSPFLSLIKSNKTKLTKRNSTENWSWLKLKWYSFAMPFKINFKRIAYKLLCWHICSVKLMFLDRFWYSWRFREILQRFEIGSLYVNWPLEITRSFHNSAAARPF